MSTAVEKLVASFTPPSWWSNAHVQSILPSLRIRKPAIARRAASLLRASDTQVIDCGNDVRLLGHLSRRPADDAATPRDLVVLLHGWEGSAESLYVLSLGGYLYELGCDVLRLNFRDHGPSHHLNEGVFHSCLLPEVIGALINVQRANPDRALTVAGFSLGGNFALRVAADGPEAGLKLERAIGVCPVLHPLASIKAIDDGWFVYRHYFLQKWKRSLRLKQSLFPQRYKFEHILRQNTLWSMTELMLEYYSEFTSVEHYLNSYAITGDRLARLTVPGHMFMALDDPIIPASDLQHIAQTPMLDVTRSPIGGHCGFMDAWLSESWTDRQIARLIGLIR